MVDSSIMADHNLVRLVNVKVTTGKTSVTFTWDFAGDTSDVAHVNTVRVARLDGVDSNGTGAWKGFTGPGAKKFQFSYLQPQEYTFTLTPKVNDVEQQTVTIKATPLGEVTVTPTQPTVPTVTPTDAPAVSGATFKPMTLGAAVTGAADGSFNRWAGKRHGLYSTWADNGKIWAIDTPSSEYGTDAVARLGDFDLNIAPQRQVSSWAGAATGNDDATWRGDLTELKNKWGNRQGHVYYRPWHEFNGTWYQWSVRSTDDAKNMVKASQRLRAVWDSIFAGDKRFHLEFSPNRDSVNGIDPRTCFADGVWDDIGLDYYDFGLKTGASAADWEKEKNATGSGGSPVGILAWLAFAASKGIPLALPEWGIQYGDNVLFITSMTAIFDAYRWTGTGSPAGRILGMAWHNLQGSSPDPNAGGDFFIQSGGSDYARRPGASRVLREWYQHATWLRTV